MLQLGEAAVEFGAYVRAGYEDRQSYRGESGDGAGGGRG